MLCYIVHVVLNRIASYHIVLYYIILYHFTFTSVIVLKRASYVSDSNK